MAFETPEKIVGSNIDSSEESDIERLQRQRQRKLSPEDCEGVVKKSKSYMILILVLSGLIITPLLIGMFVTPSAIVDIRVDLKGINVNPDRLIRIDTDMYVSTANATFTPSFLFVGVLYPATEGLYEREIYLGQYPNRVFSEPLKDTIANLNGVTDFFFSSSFLALTPNTGNELKLRLSADYSIVIKGIVTVDIVNTTEDRYLGFYYIINHGVRNALNMPLGTSTFGLQRGNTFMLNITAFEYDYQYIDDFFAEWNNIGDVTLYPFILNGTQTNTVNVGDLWGLA